MEQRTCTVDECERRGGTSGYCRSHYKQWHLGKPLTPLRISTRDLGRPAVCEYSGCGRPHKARGLCKAHNDLAKAGKPLRPIADRVGPVPCTGRDCDRMAIAKGLCTKHRQAQHELRLRYSLTVEEYEALLDSQGGVCAICGGVNRSGHRLAVDHDHACCPGKTSCGRCVRALLCSNCNLGLGKFRDDPLLLAAAIEYLGSSAASAAACH